MARIKSKITGDVFEAPAADFAQEPDFDIVDSSTPITTETVPNVAVPIDPSASATPVTADASVAGDVPNVLTADSTTPASLSSPTSLDSTLLTDPTSVSATGSTSAENSTSSESTLGSDLGNGVSDTTGSTTPPVVSPSSTAPESSPTSSVSDDLGNVGAGADTAPAATDAGSVSQPGVANQPPVTDSVNASPTGGPLPTNDVGMAHQAIAALEADLTAKVNELVEWTDQLKHSATAFFDALHSHVDHQAAE